MKKIIIFALFVVFVSMITVLYFIATKNKQLYAVCHTQLDKCQLYSEHYNNFEYALRNCIINSDFIIKHNKIKDMFDSDLYMNELFSTRQYLFVCRFAELQCRECVVSTVTALKRAALNDNTVFFCISNNSHGLKQIRESLKLTEDAVYQTGLFDLPAESIGYPYYFILDSALRVSNVFIPDKRFPDITADYLQLIKNKYFNKTNNETSIN
jgi:hypothetical protein